MAIWTAPGLTDTYADFVDNLQERADSQAKIFDDGVSWTSLPTGTIRWGSSNNRWEKWNGSVWSNLSTALTDVLKIANNLSDLASAATARSNLGLGSMSVINSPAPVANGGTGATDIATARTNLGLGSIATQAASAVSISGGSISGLTSLGLASSASIQFVSSGTITNCGLFQNPADTTIKTTGADYWIYFATNSINRFYIGSSGLVPTANNSYDLGSDALRMRDIFCTGRVFATIINAAIDINVHISNTAYWVFESGANKAFRPGVDGAQTLGAASHLWSTLYVGAINGAQTSIHLSDGADVHIRYIANTTGTHKFYANVTEIYRIDTDGKLNPVAVGRHDYTLSYGWAATRTLNSGSGNAADVNHIRDVVATIIADLVSHGLFQ